MTLTTVDPATGEPLATYDETGPDQLDHILERALAAAAAWRLTPPLEQADGLRRLARSLRANREKLALLATREMGEPLAEAGAEIVRGRAYDAERALLPRR